MRFTSPARVAGLTSVPSTRTCPSSGGTRPRMQRNTVDLPDPLEPRSTWTVPGCTSMDTPSSATRSPNRLVTSRSSITIEPVIPGSAPGGRGSANHARGAELRHLVRSELEEAAQDLFRVLAQHGRRRPHRARSLRQAHGHADHADFSRPRVIHLHERSARLHLRMLHDLGNAVDRAEGDALGEEYRLPLLVGAGEECLLERGDEGVPVAGASAVGALARVIGQLRPADSGAKDLPQLLAAHGEGEVARPRPERLVRQERLVGGAHGLGRLAVGEITADHGAEERELSFQHGHVDGLAPSRPLLHAEGEHDAVGRVHPRRHVRDGRAAADAVRAGLAGYADHAALRLEDEVEGGAIPVRPILAEARDRAVDDAAVPLPRLLVAEAEALEGPRAVVLEDDVASLHEAEEQRPAFGKLEIDLDALFVAMQAHEVRCLPAGQWRPPRARDVARSPRLELDHLRAEIGEHGRAERTGQGVAEIEHPDVLQRHSHHRPPATARVWP